MVEVRGMASGQREVRSTVNDGEEMGMLGGGGERANKIHVNV